MANKLPDSGPISMLDIYNVLNPPGPDPQECDYYFESIEDFEARIDDILKKNNYDLIQVSLGFSDLVDYLTNGFFNKKITSSPKMIIGKNITSFSYLFDACTSLSVISPDLFKYCNNATDFTDCFRDCNNLLEIPKNLFSNCKKIDTISECFTYCNIKIIPEGLFDNCKNITDCFGCFQSCSSLTTVPFNLFDNCSNITDCSYCFDNCSNITSKLPDLFNKQKFPKVTNGTDYAYNCTKAANYNEIPSNFGGPSTNPPVTLAENTNNTKSLVNSIIRTVNIPTSPISLNDKDFRELAGISNGQISLRDFYGKSISVPLKLHIKFKYEKNGKLTFPYGALSLLGIDILEEKSSLFNITGDEYIPNNDLITYSDNIFELYKINNQNTLEIGAGSSVELGETKNVLYIFIKNNKQELEKNSVKKIEGYIIINDIKYKAGTGFIGYTKDNNLFCIYAGNSELFLEQNVGKYIEIDLQIEQLKADPNKHYYPFDNNNWNKNEVDKIITTYKGDLSQVIFEFVNVKYIQGGFKDNLDIISTPKKFIGNDVIQVDDSFDSLFGGCVNLIHISPELFLETPNINETDEAFKNTKIQNIPEKLFFNCTKIISCYGTFENCKSLTSIPQNLFSNCPNITDFRYCFENCSGITSTVPELWKTHPNADGTDCFKGCINAANYNDIPSSWGGPA